MRFSIQNINKIKKADINLNGLTVIAGNNDTGKSTVGKLLFSTIKALSDFQCDTEKDREKVLLRYIQSIYRRMSSARVNLAQYYKQYSLLFPSTSRDFLRQLLDNAKENKQKAFLKERELFIQQLEILTPRIKALIHQDFENIAISLDNLKNPAAGIAVGLNYLIESEFINRICSLNQDEADVMLSFEDGEAIAYTIEAEHTKQVSIKNIKGLNNIIVDATYIESPLYVHMLDAILRAGTYREMNSRSYFSSMVPTHIKDFAEKIDSLRYKTNKEFKFDAIQETIGGKFRFDEKGKSLIFERDNVSFSPLNVASGIKSFGVIQMLLEADIITPDKLLIWDEPENHLHPDWQIKFANVLVLLAKMGIPVLVTTHSPYFIQGIRYYTAQNNLEKYVDYYLAEESGELSDIYNVNDDLNRIFITLSEPLNRIMNIHHCDK